MKIKSPEEYRAVLKEIEGLMMAGANTPEGDRLDALVTLVEAYEREHFALEAIEAGLADVKAGNVVDDEDLLEHLDESLRP